jgi:hypothetical protein
MVAILYTGQVRDLRDCLKWQMRSLSSLLNSDYYVYLTAVSTIHSSGTWAEQKYYFQSMSDQNAIESFIRSTLGDRLKGFAWHHAVDSDSQLSRINAINNQVMMLRKGYELAIAHETQSGAKYDTFIRVRPDNQIIPFKLSGQIMPSDENSLIIPRYYTGHVDPFFFSIGGRRAMERLILYTYPFKTSLEKDNSLPIPEVDLQLYLLSFGVNIQVKPNIALPRIDNGVVRVIGFEYRELLAKYLGLVYYAARIVLGLELKRALRFVSRRFGNMLGYD